MTVRFERLEHAQTVEMDGEWLIINTDTGLVTKLNDVGGFVWGCLEKQIGIEDLADTVHERYDVSRQVALGDVIPFMDNLQKMGLVRECTLAG